jgi:hypothetical protein
LITVGLREILLDGPVDSGSSTDDVLDRGAIAERHLRCRIARSDKGRLEHDGDVPVADIIGEVK